MKPFVVLLFLGKRPPVSRLDHDVAGHRVREFEAIGRRRPHRDLPQQILDVGTLNPFRQVLLGHDLVVQNGRRHHVLQTVIGLFFCAHDGLVAFLAAADDVVGYVENLDFDPLHVRAGDLVLMFKFQDAFDCRLRMGSSGGTLPQIGKP